jgi:thymidylate synthase
MTSTHYNIDSMWTEALEELFARGKKSSSRMGDMVEVLGWAGKLRPTNKNFLMNSRRKLDPVYASAELLWYLSRKTSIAGIVAYAPQYKNFANEGDAYGAYGHRIAHNIKGQDQLTLACQILVEKSDSRQCVITMWKPDDLVHAKTGVKKDLPCTLHWQFVVREGELHMIVSMRSQDIWLGMPYDVYVNTMCQRIVANQLGLQVGDYVHQIGSLHLYEKNREAAGEAISVKSDSHFGTGRPDLFDDLESAPLAVELEQRIRMGVLQGRGCITGCSLYQELTQGYRDAVLCCATKFKNPVKDLISNPDLRSML